MKRFGDCGGKILSVENCLPSLAESSFTCVLRQLLTVKYGYSQSPRECIIGSNDYNDNTE